MRKWVVEQLGRAAGGQEGRRANGQEGKRVGGQVVGGQAIRKEGERAKLW